jgi:DNA-binding transcriptional ArsR family regulator
MVTEIEKFDICCPTDHEIEIVWEDELQKEKEEIIYDLAEKEIVLKTVSHPLRLFTLNSLYSRPHCVCELVKKLEIGNSTMSYHLSILAKNLIVKRENRSGRMYFVLTDYGKSVVKWITTLPKLEG